MKSLRAKTGVMVVAAGGLLALSLIAAGCGSSSSGEGGKIALLLPESKTSRYEAHDRPEFEAKVEELCEECEVIFSNANQDAAQQQSQAEAALTNGAEVLVLDAVDATSAARWCRRPTSRKCRSSATTA